MKKLLAILGALSISASAGGLVVACSSDKDDTKYGDQFIKDDGGLNISAQTLLDWYNKTYGRLGKDPNKFIAQFYNVFAVSVFGDVASENSILSEKIDQESKAEIKKAWGDEQTAGSIRYKAKKAMEDKRKTYLDNKEEKLKGWLKYLRNEFPTVNDDQTSLENAWISNFILNDADSSAYKSLTSILAFNGMNSSTKWSKGTQNLSITTSNSTIHNDLLNDFKNYFKGKTLTEIEQLTLNSTGLEPDQQLSMINLINSIGGKNALKKASNQADTFTVEFIRSVEDIGSWTNFFNSISSRYNSITNKDVEIGSISEFLTTDDLVRLGKNGVIGENFINYNTTKPTNLTQIVNYIPTYEFNKNEETEITTIENKITDSTTGGRIGLLNNSQRFLSHKYFENKKPLAVSEIVLKFNNEASLDDEISLNLFVKSDSDTNGLINYFNGFDEFYNKVAKDEKISSETGLSLFESFYRGANTGNLNILNNNTWATTYLSSKNDKGLLTVDNESYSNVAKYAIYDFVNGGKNASEESKETKIDHANSNIPETTLNDKKLAFDNDGAQALSGLVQTTRRHSIDTSEQKPQDLNEGNEKANVYTVVNQDLGIIVYIDTEGLHFAKIDGYDTIKTDSETEKQSATGVETEAGKLAKESIAYDAIFGTNNSYSSYLINKDFVKKETTTPTLDEENKPETKKEWDTKNVEVQKKIQNMMSVKDYDGAINYKVENNYERFLINSSIVKTNNSTGALYEFDYLTELNSALANTDGEFKDLGQWLWIYLRNIISDGANEVTDEDLFEKFFETENGVDNKSIEEMLQQIQKIESTTSASYSTNFNNKNNSWKKSVDENARVKKEAAENDQQKQNFIPDQYIKLDFEELFKENKIWKDKVTINSLTNSLNVVFSYDKITIKNEGEE